MSHDACARWARWAPGAVHAWYRENPGPTRAERKEVEGRLARVPTVTVGPGTPGVWAPFIRQPRGAWPEGLLVQVRAVL